MLVRARKRNEIKMAYSCPLLELLVFGQMEVQDIRSKPRSTQSLSI